MTGDEPGRPAPPRILIVEDNPLNLKLIKDMLDFRGCATLATDSGAAVLELARQNRPDVVLMDIRLPDVSGMEAAQRLKADPQTWSIPIIAVTAFAMPGDRAKILASGCDHYLAKPFRVSELLTLIDAVLGREPLAGGPERDR